MAGRQCNRNLDVCGFPKDNCIYQGVSGLISGVRICCRTAMAGRDRPGLLCGRTTLRGRENSFPDMA